MVGVSYTHGTGCAASCPDTRSLYWWPISSTTSDGGPESGHTWGGLFRNLTWTQNLHGQLSLLVPASGSDADVEPGDRGGFLPGAAADGVAAAGGAMPTTVAARPADGRTGRTRVLSLLAWLTLVHTTGSPTGAWLCRCIAWFIGGMTSAVSQCLGCAPMPGRCVPLAVACYFIVLHTIAGAPTTSPNELREGLAKAFFYAVIATWRWRRWRSAIEGSTQGRRPAGRWCFSVRSPTRLPDPPDHRSPAMVEILRSPIYTGSVDGCSSLRGVRRWPGCAPTGSLGCGPWRSR